MASVVRMPSVLAGATEAAIASWLVAPGDTVSVGDPLAEIETEKAVVEYGAEEAGVVGRIVLAAGEHGAIGAPIVVLVKDGETDADIDAALGGHARPRPVACPALLVPAAHRSYESQPAQAPPARIFASPIVRKIARRGGHRPRGHRRDRPERPDRPPRPRTARRPSRPAAGEAHDGGRAAAAVPQPPAALPRPPAAAARSSRTRRSAAPSRAASPRARRRRRTST